ncbi:DUF2913 family protein [Enterobacter ludwigii]|uniref:DUF2913 family protein n=1 Tax=Enterobacter ludwigii TaxID=299767 RepID=UPI00159C7461|nr:DUF2913 family protein [Enterobacter ludwigii]QLA06949.1 DUF2913 family protein [Enterobacter ludwigii]
MKQNSIFTAEETLSALGHLAWCALVALRLAQRDGQALSPLMAHAFLMRWLGAAQRQKRFSRAIADDIEGLLRCGRQKGAGAQLQQRLEGGLAAISGPVQEQSELHRLTFAIDRLKSLGWINAVLTDKEWLRESLRDEYAGERALLVRKSELVRQFSDAGRLLGHVTFMTTGEPDAVRDTLSAFALSSDVAEPDLIILKPSSGGA